MPRYSCVISYDGGKFCGWQVQPNGVSVQQRLEEALTLLNGNPVKAAGAGRTDAGVHAKGQVASFSMNRSWTPRKLMLAINAHLPEAASVTSVQEREENFDARRCALWREYAYFIWRGSFCYPQMKPYVWWKKQDQWDAEQIRLACAMMEGVHDFSAFCRAGEVPDNPIRRMHFVRWVQRGRLSILRVRGDAFLTNMIRIMVGNLDQIGAGKKSLSWLQGLLEGGNRSDSAMTVPPQGLFFWRVGYPEQNKVQ